MNYYELFDLPVGFSIDQASLRRKYFELSRMLHPDYFTRSPRHEQALALEKSAMLNQAYKTFQSRDATIQYLLELKGLIVPGEKFQLDPVFLAEVMELNEALMELEMDPEAAGLEQVERAVQSLTQKIDQDVEKHLDNHQEAVASEEALLQVREYYYRKKYLQRILDKMATLRNIATR